MSSDDDLPSDKPGLFNTFSGKEVPIEAYNLLSPEEAAKNLTARDRVEYKGPEFALVWRSRIWDELKSSVAERREAYLERQRHKASEEHKSEDKNDSDEKHIEDHHEKQENESQNISTPTENSNIDINDHPIYSNDNDDNDGFIYTETSHHDTESDKEHEEQDIEANHTFANPFNPLQTAVDRDNNNERQYAIPFDVFDINNNNANNTNIEDDIWANWASPFHDNEAQEVMDNINDSNDSKTTLKNVRKSEIFADPFHWDTDDENNHNLDIETDDDDDDDEDEDDLKHDTMTVDVNTPFTDPFHSTPNDTDGHNKHNGMFANPFEIDINGTIESKASHTNQDIFGIIFGETEEHNDDNNESQPLQFRNPFQQPNHNDELQQLPLSPIMHLPFNPIQQRNEPIVNPFPQNEHNKAQLSPTPIKINIDTNIASHALAPPTVTLTPVPQTVPEKRSSAVMAIPVLKNTLNESEEQEYSPVPQIKHTEIVSAPAHRYSQDELSLNEPFAIVNDADDGKDEKTETPIVIAPKKKNSLSFSWSDRTHSFDELPNTTPPPAKTMNDELYELLATLLAKVMHNPRAFYMVDGVPWEKWGCLDWPRHIKPPSTLTQVRNALDNNDYDTPGQFAESVRNVFRNYTTYHWKGAGQYRVNTRANILWEEFNIEYFQVLADESEERKRDDSRKRAIDEAREKNDSREPEFSNTHTVSTDLDEEEEAPAEEGTPERKHVKTVSFFKGDIKEDQSVIDETEQEIAAMAKVHYELSQHLSTRPNTPAYTPQPPFLDLTMEPDLPALGLGGNPLGTLFSQHEVVVLHGTPRITVSEAGHSPLPRPEPMQPAASLPNASRRVSMESLGAVSVNSRNVRFQSPQQAERALRISNALQVLHKEESISRQGSISSITSIFRKKKSKFDLARAALLAKLSKTLPDGWNPNQRRGSIIRTKTSRASTVLPPIVTNGTLAGVSIKSKSEDLESIETPETPEPGCRHRSSKELIDDFSPPFKSKLPQTEEMPTLDLELQKNLDEGVVPGQYAHLKFEFFIMSFCCVLLIIYMIYYRLFSNETYPLLYPMKNIGARIMSVLFTEPLFIVCMLGSMIVIHVQYRPDLVVVHRNLFIAVFVIANILNILRVSISHCSMDFIYNIYIYFIAMCTMILPFFSFDNKWKESETVFILFVFWIGIILMGFVFVILHAYITGFIFIICYIMLSAWIIRFLYYKSLGVFDDIGNLSSAYDIGYCCLLIPALLLFPQLGAAVVIELNSINVTYSAVLSSVYGYYILLKITFCIGRSLWETTALKGTDHSSYIHLMFPIFFIEELLDTFLLMKLKFSWEIIGLLMLMAMTHIIRDSDIGYRVIYKAWLIPLITTVYYGYNISDSRRNLYAPQNDEDRECQTDIGIDIDIIEEDKLKELNLAQERDDIHLARIIIHFQMIQFAEFASRAAVILLILMDIICDAMHIGQRLLLIDNGTIYEAKRGLLILIYFISLIIIFITNIISQRLLSEHALTSIQFLEKLECVHDFSYKQRLYIHQWVIFGDDCEIFKRFWIFFAFIVGYQLIILSQAFFTNNGLVSICDVFF